jgi:nitrate reductase gamma subunit
VGATASLCQLGDKAALAGGAIASWSNFLWICGFLAVTFSLSFLLQRSTNRRARQTTARQLILAALLLLAGIVVLFCNTAPFIRR